MAGASATRVVGKEEKRADFVAVPCFERQAPEVSNLAAPLARAARAAADRQGFTGKPGQRTQVRSGNPKAPAVVVYGLGKAKAFKRRGLARYLDRAVREARRDGFKTPLVRVPEHEVSKGVAAAAAVHRTAALAGYRFEDFLAKARPGAIRQVRLAVSPQMEADYRRAHRQAKATVDGIVRTRNLANTPPNEAYPESMAAWCRELAKSRGMKAKVLGPKELERKGMGGILAVGGGSRRSPRMVVLEWGEGSERISLVGKGVTFDTGGISIKPAAAMDEMKFDKSGACVVMGIADAAAAMDLPFRFRAYLPFAENMPDGAAYRPGDIVRCYGGKTVEIMNTDAEGRMLLADALALAEEDGSDVIVDYATLTGACVVALGEHGAGLFTHDDDLAEGLLGAAGEAGEYLWRLPLWPEFTDEMKGQHGDLRNTGSRWGGASSAAAFLSQFVRTKSWAHVDIAGPSYVSRTDRKRFGATGYGVATTIGWLVDRAG